MITCNRVRLSTSRAVMISPYEGVVPPSGMLAQSSTRLAPPSWAAKQLSTLLAHTSNCNRLLVGFILRSFQWSFILFFEVGVFTPNKRQSNVFSRCSFKEFSYPRLGHRTGFKSQKTTALPWGVGATRARHYPLHGKDTNYI